MRMNELKSKVNQLRELRRMADELAAEITATEDSTVLKAVTLELWQRVSKPIIFRRFIVA